MRRLPGRKFRKERFTVDGALIEVEVRLTDSGRFFADVDQVHLEMDTLAELRDAIKPVLERTRRLEWDPFIKVEYEEAEDNSRFDNHNGDENRQEVTLAFEAGYLSRTKVPGGRSGEMNHKWADAEVNEAGEVLPLDDKSRHEAGSCWSPESLIPFTSSRWLTLQAIAGAIADVRVRIATLLGDKNGGLLDAIPAHGRVLEAMPAASPKKRRGDDTPRDTGGEA